MMMYNFPSAEKNKSYAISSFVETKGEQMIAKSAVEFVEYPLHFIDQYFKNFIAIIFLKTAHISWFHTFLLANQLGTYFVHIRGHLK